MIFGNFKNPLGINMMNMDQKHHQMELSTHWHIKEKFVDKVQTILLTMHYCLFIIIRTSSSLWFSVKKASNYCPTFFLCYYSVWKLRSKYYKAPLPPPSLSLPQWSELTKKHLIRTRMKKLPNILVFVW